MRRLRILPAENAADAKGHRRFCCSCERRRCVFDPTGGTGYQTLDQSTLVVHAIFGVIGASCHSIRSVIYFE
jgi:hypothetical protein